MLNYLGAEEADYIIEKMIISGSFSALNKKDRAYGDHAHLINKMVIKTFNPISKKFASKLSMIILESIARIRTIFNTTSRASDPTNNSHYRKGISGDWKNHLSNEEADHIDKELDNLHKAVLAKVA